jgi:hypothetical protein
MRTLLTLKECIVFAEAMAAVAGFITWRKWKGSYYQWLPFYLAAITICECVGYYLGAAKNYEALKILYSWFVIPLEISFICWIFYKRMPERSTIIISLWLFYLLLLGLDFFYFNSKDYILMSVSYTAGNAIILFLVLAFFSRLMSGSGILYFKSDILFWVSAGLLLFYLGTFPYYCLYNIMAKQYMPVFIGYTWVMICLNYIMYLLFTAGFIWGKAR